MWGLGKQRSRLGKWIDRSGRSQEELVAESGVSRNTISKACSDEDYVPSPSVARRILEAVRKIDANKKYDDFWPM